MRHSAALLLALLLAPAVQAREVIQDFASEIFINADGSQQVTETIRARAEGVDIKHGIYRDFPTAYHDAHGEPVNVEFTLEGIRRDGETITGSTAAIANGTRVYLGTPNDLVAPGVHTWSLTYRTSHQIGYFDMDELYWNVTGNSWVFPIEHASARIHLPSAVPVAQMKAEAYTGYKGDKGTDWQASLPEPGLGVFSTTAPLAPQQNLTVVLRFPKGIVASPAEVERADGDRQNAMQFGRELQRARMERYGMLIAGGTLLAALLCHGLFWSRFGRDRAPGPEFPRYEPPSGYSPSEMRYLMRLEYDAKCLSADLLQLSANGTVALSHAGGGWSAELADAKAPVPETGKAMLSELMPGSATSVMFNQYNAREITKALAAHEQAVSRRVLGKLYSYNIGPLMPGMLVSLAGMILAIKIASALNSMFLPLLLFFGCWVFTQTQTLAISERIERLLKLRAAFWPTARVVLRIVVALLFGAVLWFLLWTQFINHGFFAEAAAVIVLNSFFGVVMQSYKREGADLVDTLRGLRLYLGVAEKQDLHKLAEPSTAGAAASREPPLTVARFQQLLPWAMALDVEDAWTGRLTNEIGAVALQEAMPDYQQFSTLYVLTDNISSYSNWRDPATISTSSSDDSPGSFSGGDGGGSSGDGGGGGGGGGF